MNKPPCDHFINDFHCLCVHARCQKTITAIYYTSARREHIYLLLETLKHLETHFLDDFPL